MTTRGYITCSIESTAIGALGVELMLTPARRRDLAVEIKNGLTFAPLAAERGEDSIFITALPLRTAMLDGGATIRIGAADDALQVTEIRRIDTLVQRLGKQNELRRWLRDRRESATSPAQLLFLEIDTYGNPYVVQADGRDAAFAINTMRVLVNRIAALGTEPSLNVAAQRIALAHAQQISEIFDQAHRTHCPDPAALESAYEEFAGGQLRQPLPFDIAGSRMIAGDADSGLIFLFAELVFAIRDAAEDETLAATEQAAWKSLWRNWAPLLNCLVRMQSIYLDRFSHSARGAPAEFVQLPDAPVLDPLAFRDAVKRARQDHAGKSVEGLRAMMIRRLVSLAGRHGQGFQP